MNSEAVQFIDAIRYGFEPILSKAEVDGLIQKLGSNYYQVKSSNIDDVLKTLRSKLEISSQ